MDFSEFKGQPLSEKARELMGERNTGGIIKTDEDVAYELFAQKGIALYPLSFYQADGERCLLRITCGAGMQKMKEVMDDIELFVEEMREKSLPEGIRNNLSQRKGGDFQNRL
jgi:aspartate/methionine/tyrosine aminotransferase